MNQIKLSTLIQTNEYNTEKQNLEGKNKDFENKMPSDLVTTSEFKTKKWRS